MTATIESVRAPQGAQGNAVNNNVGVLTPAVHAMAERDAKVYKSHTETRKELRVALRGLGKRCENFDADKDPGFYREMKAISRSLVSEKASDKFLTDAEKADLPDGKYRIGVLLDSSIKGAALPPFLTEPNRSGKRSIRWYWQAQADGWYTSVYNSMARYEKSLEMASSPDARTAQHAELQAKAINSVIKRERACADASQVLKAAELNYLIKVTNRLAKEHGTPALETK